MRVETGIKAGILLGDAVAGFTEATRLDRIAHAYEQITGRSCGCEERRQRWNRLFH